MVRGPIFSINVPVCGSSADSAEVAMRLVKSRRPCMSKIAIVLPAAFWTCNTRPAVETVNCGAKPVPRIASEASLLLESSCTSTGSVTLLLLLDVTSAGSVTLLLLLDTLVSLSLDCGETLLLDFAEELDAGAVPFPVTVMVPLFEAFVVAPVVVTVNLYAPGATLDATVPEM